MKKTLIATSLLAIFAVPAVNASNADVNHFLRTADMASNHNATALANIVKEYKGLNSRDRLYVDGIADLTPWANVIKETAAQVKTGTDMAAGWDAVKTEQQVREAHIAAKNPQATPDAIPVASPAGKAAPQVQPQATPVVNATPSIKAAPQIQPQATPSAAPVLKSVPQVVPQMSPVLQLTPVTHAAPAALHQETPVALSDVDYAAKTIADVKANADYNDGSVEHKLKATELGKEAQRADAIVKANHQTPSIKPVPQQIPQATPVLKATPAVQVAPQVQPQATPAAVPAVKAVPQIQPQATPFASPSVAKAPVLEPQATPFASPSVVNAPSLVPHAEPTVQQRTPDPVPNESIAHRDRYAMRPVHNPDTLAETQRLAHNPLYSGTEIGQKASAVDENAVAHKLNQKAHHDERVAHQARYQSTPLLAQQEAAQARANEAVAHDNRAYAKVAVDAAKREDLKARVNEVSAHDNRGYAQAVAQSQQMAKLLADPDFNATPAVLADQTVAPKAEVAPRGEKGSVTGSGNGAPATTMTTTAVINAIDSRIDTQAQKQKGIDDAQDTVTATKADLVDLQKTQREVSNLQTVADEAHQTAYDNKADVATLKTDVKGVQSEVAKKADQSELATVKSQLNTQVATVESKLNLKADQSALDVVKTTADKNQQDINDHKGLISGNANAVKTAQAKADQNGQAIANQAGLISANTNAAKTAQDKADQNGQTIANQAGLIASNTSTANTAKTTADNAVKAAQKVQGEVNTLDGKVTANANALTAKVDTTTYDAGQKAQDAAIGQKADTSTVTALKSSVDSNTQLIQSTATTMKSDEHLISVNAQGVSDNHDAIQANKADIGTNKSDIQKQAQQFTQLQSNVDQKVDTSTFTQRSTVVDQRFADTAARIQQHKDDQDKVNKAMAGRIDDHEGRIQKLEQNTNQNFKDLDKKIDANRKHASRGIAGSNALAGLPQLDHEQTFAVAAAAGGYDGETAMAVGFSAHPFESKQVVLKAGVTGTNGGNIGWNVGTSIGW